MKIRASLSLSLSFFLLFQFQFANAFNITQILLQYPDFSSFNNYLTKANLAGNINSREAITVLVVENANLSPISGKSPPVLANIMSVHVLLDYFDVPKLQHPRNNGPIMVTTLFQTFGTARGRQGFLNVTHLKTGSVAFGSAAAGSTAGSNLVKSVFTEPYNISVLQVSNIVVPPGVEGPATAPARGPVRAQPPAASPAPWSRGPIRAPSPSMPPRASTIGTPPTAPGRAPTAPGRAPTPSASTAAPKPASALTPNAADSPAAGVGPAAADSGRAAATETGGASDAAAGTTLRVGFVVVCTVLVSSLRLVSRI